MSWSGTRCTTSSMVQEDEEHPQMPPRTCHMEQQGTGSGPEKDSTPIARSTVVEPRPEAERTEGLEAETTV